MMGRLLAEGRTSEVFEYGTDSVVKVLRPRVPSGWAALEARLTEAVPAGGVRVPEVRALIDVGGRPGIVFERIRGSSMWQRILDRPNHASALGRELASIHRVVQQMGVPSGFPDLVARLRQKVLEVDQLSEEGRREACAIVGTLPRGAALLHGDLHPGNVLMHSRGPVVIDWFDAVIGHPVADVVRTSILLRQPLTGGVPAHLPGATPELLGVLHDTYAREFTDVLSSAGQDIWSWEPVLAVGRLAEGVEGEEVSLKALWNSRADAVASNPLRSCLGGRGVDDDAS